MNSGIILIEGIPGTGKTALINAMIKKYVTQNEKISTLFHLSQSHTYRPVVFDEENFYANKIGILNHLEKIFEFLHWNVSVGTNKNHNRFVCIIDTLHVTHCFRPGNISWADITEYDRQLAGINCKLVFLKALPGTIWQRAILQRSKMDDLYLSKYQKKYGNTLEEVHQYYMCEQDKMEKLVKQSALNSMILNSENTIEANAEMAYDFWLAI